MPIKTVALLITLVFTASCAGYALVGKGSSLPPNIRSIDIQLFKNKTAEPNLDTRMTQAVQDGFIKDGRLKVVSAGSRADSILEGAIEAYSLRPVAYDANNKVTEYVVSLTLAIKHTVSRSGKVLTKQTFTKDWRYQVEQSITLAENLRIAAIKEASTQAAESIITMVIESF